MCSGCGSTGPFYSTIRKWCKECWKAHVRANRSRNIEHYREYDRARSMLAKRIEERMVYAALNPEDARESKATWARNNPEKRRAHFAVKNALRDRRLFRQPCEKCGRRGHAHHDDYSKPLSVRWLCPKHHHEHHAGVS